MHFRRVADTVLRAITRTDNTTVQWKQLGHTLQQAYSAHHKLTKSARQGEAQAVARWAAALHAATKTANAHFLISLRTVALVKARKAEAATASVRAHEWKVCLGIKAPQPQAAPRPTRLAYRWVKGLTGWIKSPWGPPAANDAVAAEGEDLESDGDEVVDD